MLKKSPLLITLLLNLLKIAQVSFQLILCCKRVERGYVFSGILPLFRDGLFLPYSKAAVYHISPSSWKRLNQEISLACLLCLQGVTLLPSQLVVQTLQLLNKHLFTHIHTLLEIFTLILLWQRNPVPTRLWVTTVQLRMGMFHQHLSRMPTLPKHQRMGNTPAPDQH